MNSSLRNGRNTLITSIEADRRENSVTGDSCGPETFALSSVEVHQGTRRLEVSFYGSRGYQAVKSLTQSRFALLRVGDHASVFHPPIFKRCYVSTPEAGVPYLTGSAILEARRRPQAYLSRTRTPELPQLLARDGMVMITDSGSVGKVVKATKEIDGWATTNNLIRVVSDDPARFSQEFFYAFFQSVIGQYLLTRNTYGSVVQHIEPEHVANMRFPLVPKALREELTRSVGEACRLRVEANATLRRAEEDLMHQCGLPHSGSLLPDKTALRRAEGLSFLQGSNLVFNGLGGFGRHRLDAHFYEPTAIRVRDYIMSRCRGVPLGELAEEVRNSALRKRTYAEAPNGIPLIGGKQLTQLRPSDVSYLSRSLTRSIQDEIVQEGWTLVSCGGTLGNTIYVHRNFEGWIASQHVMRIIPNESRVWPGFLYSFLSSSYGQIQIYQCQYGSVIPEIRDFQFESVAVPSLEDRGESIHKEVVRAFDAFADARGHEDRAVDLFENALREGRQSVEARWGKEY